MRWLLYLLLLCMTCSGSGCDCRPVDGGGCSVGGGDGDYSCGFDDDAADAGADAGFGNPSDAGSSDTDALCAKLSAARATPEPAELAVIAQSGADPYVYEGELRVTGAVASALELTGSDRTRTEWSGIHPTLAEGKTLWASLDQRIPRPVPRPPFRTRRNLVRVSRKGAILADDQWVGIPASGELVFLGVHTRVERLCTIQTSCQSESYYGVTVHGDVDLKLAPGDRGRVAIGGVQYEVALVGAAETSYSACTAPGGMGTPPLYLVGHAVDFADLLSKAKPEEEPTPDLDAGHESDAGGGHENENENDGG